MSAKPYVLYSCMLTSENPVNYDGVLWCAHTNTALRNNFRKSGIIQHPEAIEDLMHSLHDWALHKQYPPGATISALMNFDNGPNVFEAYFAYIKAPFLPKTYMFEVENTMIRSTMGYLRAQTPLADDCLRKLDHIGIQQLVTSKWQQVRGLHESNQPSVSRPETLLLEGAIHTHLPVDYWFDDHTQIRLNPPDEKPARSR